MIRHIGRAAKRLLADEAYRAHWLIKYHMRGTPRYQTRHVSVLGYDLEVVDSASFKHSFREIFVDEIYAFESGTAQPRIIDCGANIGLSVLFFKRMYPSARLTAFEADPSVCATLRRNLAVNSVQDVDVRQEAVWTEHTTLDFHIEGADAGRVHALEARQSVEVTAVRLRNVLHEPVEMLKMDVEGAEVHIIPDIRDELQNVRHVFVEYHSFADDDQKFSGVIDALEDAGFRIQIQPVFGSPRPFTEQPTRLGMDMQLNIFGYRSS